MTSKNGSNGARAKVLARGKRGLGEYPEGQQLLHAGFIEVLSGLAMTDVEKGIIANDLRSWEERPHASLLVDTLRLRAEDKGDTQILQWAEGFRRSLPEANWQPPPDPELERLILEQAGKRAAAEAVSSLKLDALVGIRVAIIQAQRRAADVDHRNMDDSQVAQLQEEVRRLQAREAGAVAERKAAADVADAEASRLADLLQMRVDRHRALAIERVTTR